MRGEDPRFGPDEGDSCRALALAMLWLLFLIALAIVLAAIGWAPAL